MSHPEERDITAVVEAELRALARAPDDALSRLEPGIRLADRFELSECLGAGGSGVVYAARDHAVGEEVAVKILHAWLYGDATWAQRLRAEVRVARRIAHPNVCRVHDLGEHEGLMFVTMERLHGETLRPHLGRVALAQWLEIARQLGAGLSAAHRAGVVHCDLKPANVILAEGRVVLTDFGIARQIATGPSVGAPGERARTALEGTPHYMAPEQIAGAAVDERTDVHGFAALLFHLLAGRAPYDEGRLRAGPDSRPLRLPAAAGVDPAILVSLDAVLARAMARDPAARFESVEALVAGLVAAASGAARERTVARSSLGPSRVRRIATVAHVLIEMVAGDDAEEEAAAEASQALLAAAEAALVDGGGFVAGRAPNARMAVFGLDQSRGDESLRAADAVWAVLAAAHELRGVLVRAGIDAGRVLTLPDEPTVVGEALGSALQLASRAEAGTLCVSARVARHLGRRFDLAASPASPNVLQVTGRHRRGDRLAAMMLPFVGRDRQLHLVADELTAALQGRGGGAVLVLGPMGIGKSRLRREVAELLATRGGAEILSIGCEPEDALAASSVIGAILRRLREDGAELPATPPVANAALRDAAARHPQVIAVDDAHWADDASLDWLDGLVRGAAPGPIALLVLARPDLLARRPTFAERFATRIELAPLSAPEAQELARLRLGNAAREDAVQAIAGASDGLPFFIEELARDWLERGGSAAEAPPVHVEQTIQARLDRLPREARELLRAASVLGRSFRRRDLEELFAALPERGRLGEALDPLLALLEERHIAFPIPPDGFADDRYVLKHALVREVAYQELPPGERRRLHAAAAAALRARHDPPRSDEVQFLVELGHHLDAAGERTEAALRYRRAGEVASAQGAAGDAYRCYSRAHELGGGELELSVALGEAALAAGVFAEAARFLDAAVAKSEGASPLLPRALLARAGLAKQLAHWDEAADLCRRGIALVDEDAEPVLASRLHALLGWVRGYMLGEIAAGLEEGERAVALLAGVADRAELARCYGSVAATYMRGGRWRDQRRCNEQSLAIAEEVGALELAARAHLNLGVNLHGLGELESSLEHGRRALALYDRMCAPAHAALAQNNLAMVLVDLGRLEEAERQVEEALRQAERCGGCYFRGEAELSLARIAAKRGDLSAAQEHARAALGQACADGSPIDEGIALRTIGALRSHGGEHAAAREALDAAVAILEERDVGEAARARAERARVLARSGELAAASAESAEARRRLEALGAAQDLEHLEDLRWI